MFLLASAPLQLGELPPRGPGYLKAAVGGLTLEELQRRLDLVFSAETLVDLYELASDLPHPGARAITPPGFQFQVRDPQAKLVALRLRSAHMAGAGQYI